MAFDCAIGISFFSGCTMYFSLTHGSTSSSGCSQIPLEQRYQFVPKTLSTCSHAVKWTATHTKALSRWEGSKLSQTGHLLMKTFCDGANVGLSENYAKISKFNGLSVDHNFPLNIAMRGYPLSNEPMWIFLPQYPLPVRAGQRGQVPAGSRIFWRSTMTEYRIIGVSVSMQELQIP